MAEPQPTITVPAHMPEPQLTITVPASWVEVMRTANPHATVVAAPERKVQLQLVDKPKSAQIPPK